MQYHFETKDQMETCMRNENFQDVAKLTKKILKLEQYVTNCKIAYDEEMEEHQKLAIQMIDSESSEHISSFGESSNALQTTCLILMNGKTELLWMKKCTKENEESFERYLQSELKGFQKVLDEREMEEKQRKLTEVEKEEALSMAFIATMDSLR
jgi:hypothetical protein